MSPGKARLYVGISGVGTLVLIAVVMLSLDSPRLMFPLVPSHGQTEYFAFMIFFAGIAAVLLPFDLIGGLHIPSKYEGETPNLTAWLRKWAFAAILQVLFFATTFFMYLQVVRIFGAFYLIALFIVMQLTLLAGQLAIWQLMSSQSISQRTDDSVLFVSHSDHRFTGGVSGIPGFEMIVIPSAWRDKMTSSHINTLVERRGKAIESNGRLRGSLFALIWNTTGLSIALLISGFAISSVAGLITVFLWYLLFSFVGLLVLPAINRQSVFALDRCYIENGQKDELLQSLAELDQLTEQDPSRTVSAESVFQPIPCPARRAKALSEKGSTFVLAWNVARTALFLSWAFGGPLARAVHCNVGRPELWSMLPTD